MDVFKKQLLLQLAIALGIAVVLVAATQLTALELQKAALIIQEKKVSLTFLSRATDLVPQLKSDLAKAQPLINELNRILPPKAQLANFDKELTELAKKTGIGINFSLVGEQAESLQFLMTSDVTYSNFVKFLKELEQSRFFVKINSLNMTRQASGGKYNIVANAEVFYQ